MMEVGSTNSPEDGLPRNAWTDFEHTGPGTLAGQYLRTFWHPVYRAQDLRPGRTMPIKLMGEDFTLYRGENGTVHALAFRCAHRGTQLSTGWVEGEDLRCFYHGWKYDATGQCIEQPAEPEPFCQKVRIQSYPVQEYLGLTFAYLGGGDAPPLPRYPEFESEEELLEVTIREPWPCNYFNRIENAPDLVHLTYTHYHLGYGVPVKMEAVHREYGVETRAYYANGAVQQVHYQMPTISQYQVPPYNAAEAGWRERVGWRVPVDDEHYVDVLVTLVHITGDAKDEYVERQAARPSQDTNKAMVETAEAVLAGRMTLRDVGEPWYLTELQDYITLTGQGVIADRSQDHLGQSDAGVVLIRRLWERELARLASSQPLTEWKRPERLEVLTAVG